MGDLGSSPSNVDDLDVGEARPLGMGSVNSYLSKGFGWFEASANPHPILPGLFAVGNEFVDALNLREGYTYGELVLTVTPEMKLLFHLIRDVIVILTISTRGPDWCIPSV